MLSFFPAIYPWTYLYTDMKDILPVGSFYSYTNNILPRGANPNEFWLVTDRDDAVIITINGKVVGRLYPRSRVQRIFLGLYDPPAFNDIKVDNGVDAPVYLKVVVTHVAKELEVGARELYAYAGRTVEKYSDLIASPWASFIADYQLPWRKELPNVRSLRMMSVKMIANTLFGKGGGDQGVKDFLSAFTTTTPVVVGPKNPSVWQPSLYQPISSGFDNFGFDIHTWIPNACIVKWAAFLKLRDNVAESFDIYKFSEESIFVAPLGTEYISPDSPVFFEQHLTPSTGEGCTLLDEILALGCMDNITCAGALKFKSQPAICAYAEPFDRQVERPGIGGRFFDSGPTFDAELSGTETVIVPLVPPYEVQLAHTALVLTGGGYGDVTLYDVTASVALTPEAPPAPPSGPGFVTAPIDGLLTFDPAEAGHTVRVDYLYTVSLDSIYDIDLMTDYWVETSLVKRFDFGCFLDAYPTQCLLPADTNCCIQAPDTVLLSTLAYDNSVTSPVTPNNPLFGGDVPGLLENPYFNVLI